MIAISQVLRPELRDKSLMELEAAGNVARLHLYTTEERKRFYIIVSFACNAKCAYCLFRFERIRDCSHQTIADKVRRVFRAFPHENFSVSVTGGEPFLRPRRTRAILDAIRDTAKPENTRWIGFGTNGTGVVPGYLNEYGDFTFDIYLSRHHYDPDVLAGIFGMKDLNQPSDYTTTFGPNVRVKLSCNLIRGGIDSLDGIKRMLEYAQAGGVRHITFRELNRVADDASMYNEGYILDYIRYYDTHLVALKDLLPQVERDSAFRFLSQDVRPFIYHEHWAYGDIQVTFRHIDEKQLLDYNAGFDGIDEIVVHPDGLITGCWDREQKRLDL